MTIMLALPLDSDQSWQSSSQRSKKAGQFLSLANCSPLQLEPNIGICEEQELKLESEELDEWDSHDTDFEEYVKAEKEYSMWAWRSMGVYLAAILARSPSGE